jgi:TonB family protein
MRKVAWLAALCLLCVAVNVLSLRAAADPPAAPSSAPQPMASDERVPFDQFGHPLACDRFLPPGIWRPSDNRGTLVSVRVTADGNLHDAALYRSSGDDNLDKAALSCAPTFHIHVTQNGKPAEFVWIVAVYWHTSWSSIGVPKRVEPGACSPGVYWVTTASVHDRARFSFRIEPDGTVGDVSLTTSSGSDTLDAIAVRCVSRWLFFPAEQDHHPIAVDWNGWVQFGRSR